LVQTTGVSPMKAGSTSDDFQINGVMIGKIEYQDNDQNGALIAAINSVKDATGVEAAKDENGRLLLTSRDGRGIKITGSMGAGTGIGKDKYENYGRLSLIKN
ncbi:flagellin hook IN motif-containing protein, partial [Campylobacter insulaenigrae]|uniref:flagellin hook IN motif-containing protein n=1 Tax=Campylobacter insulaenigrae TaxID=260714 RepID=UPI0027E50EAD